MGLDMYLRAKKTMPLVQAATLRRADPEVFSNWDNNWPMEGDPDTLVELTGEIGYWRKANGVHRWFVENVQGGTDDCGHYVVSEERLRKLRADCQAVLDGNDPRPHHLAPLSGFFFGGTDLDAYYQDGLKNTIEMVDETLKDYPGWQYQYHSSW